MKKYEKDDGISQLKEIPNIRVLVMVLTKKNGIKTMRRLKSQGKARGEIQGKLGASGLKMQLASRY